MRMGLIDQLELFGAGCRPVTTLVATRLPAWAAPTAEQVLREQISRQLDAPVMCTCGVNWEPRHDEDPERWDGLS